MVETQETDFYCPYCPTNGTRGSNQLNCPYYPELKPNYILWERYRKRPHAGSPETQKIVREFLPLINALSTDSCSLALTMYFLLVVDKTDRGLSKIL